MDRRWVYFADGQVHHFLLLYAQLTGSYLAFPVERISLIPKEC